MESAPWFSWTENSITYTVRLANVVALQERESSSPCTVHLRGMAGYPIHVSQAVAAKLKEVLGASRPGAKC